MANASNVQTDFLGGEWSPYAQGRLDDPEYKRGMNVCRNVIPIESGAATRRTGTKKLGFTRHGQVGRLMNFQFTGSTPYTMEFTDGYLRFYDSQQLVLAEEPRIVQYVNQACPAVMKTSTTCADTWNDGDTVIFNDLKPAPSTTSYLLDKQFTIRAGSDDQHWTLFDGLTGQPVDGSLINWNVNMALQVSRVLELQTPYVNGTWENLRMTQSDDMVFLWHPNLPPYVIFAPLDGGSQFTINKAVFKDGPYLDPPTDGSYLTVSGQSGAITVQIAYPAWSSSVTYANATNFVNNTQTRGPNGTTLVQYANGGVVSSGGNLYASIADGNTNHSPPNTSWWKLLPSGQTFASTDVGRLIRLFAEPAAWVAGTAYTTGNLVKYQDDYYTALQNSTGKVPGTDADNWGVAANAAAWTWGIITAYSSPTSVTVSIQGDPLLYNQNVLTWRLGAFSDTTGYPACGAFHEGRLWAAGCIKNRFDTSGATDDIFNFAPTAPDGTVADDNAISYILKSKTRNQILWMNPALGGILMGTSQSEWLTQSSANNDPITPTNIQSHDHTAIGSSNVEAVRCGTTVAFVQRYGNQVIEYLADLFSGKPAGKNLALRAKHLTKAGVIRMGYQQETYPVLWMLTADGKLLGSSYKRESLMVSQPPNFNGWHRHDLGSGYNVLDLVVGSAPGGLYETATIITQDPATGYCYVEAITEMFQETDTLADAWFLDNAVAPRGGSPSTVGGINGITFGGLAHLEGKTVSAYISGLDTGNYTVTNGQIFVPYQSDPDKLFTLAFIQAHPPGVKFSTTVQVPSAATSENIMEFPPISSTVLNNFTQLNYGSQAIADWARDRVTFLLPGTAPYCGFIQYTISTGAFVKYATIDQVFGAPVPPLYDNTATYSATPKVLGSDNNIYTVQVSKSYGVDPTSAGQTDWVIDTSNAPYGTVPAAYNSGTTYATGNYVSSAGIIYRSLQNSNTGHTPASSPTFWQVYDTVPAAWSSTTVYGTFVSVTGSNGHIYWPWGNVPAGQGDPSSFSTNNNPYWQTAGAVWPVGIITTSGLGLDYNGDIWMYQSGTSFNSTYVKIDGGTLKVKGSVTKASGLSVPTPSNYSFPMRILNNNGTSFHDYMVETVDTTPSGVGSTPSAVVMDVTGMRINSSSTVSFDEGSHPTAAAGASQIGWAQLFALTRPLNGQADVGSIGLYEVDVVLPPQTLVRKQQYIASLVDPNLIPKLLYSTTTTINKTKKGTISPANVDSTWTFFSGIGGLMYDPNDGNVMFFASTQNPSNWSSLTTYNIGTGLNNYAVGSDGKVYKSIANSNLNHDPTTDGGVHWSVANTTTATQTSYLVKFTANCAKLVWRVPVANGPTAGGEQFINLSSGYYDFLESLGLGAWQVRRVDLLSGQASILYPGQAGVTQLGDAQVYNGATGDIISYVTYDHSASGTTPPPAPVNPSGGTTPNNFTGWARMNVTPAVLNYQTAGAVGFTYTSQGQILRPVSPQESGARNGPAFGKTRRNHRYATALANAIGGAQGIGFGTVFPNTTTPAGTTLKANIRAALLATVGKTPYNGSQLYTGEWSATIEDDYSYDGMVGWQITRPVPATVTALGGFIETMDR